MTARDAVPPVVVVGPPGCGGELVVAALVHAGLEDVTPIVVEQNDAWLDTWRATRLAPPVDGLPGGSSVGDLLGPEPYRQPAGTVSFDPVSALVRTGETDRRAARLAVIVTCRPERSVARLRPSGVGTAHAFALWQHYFRRALAFAQGGPLVVVDGDSLGPGASAAVVPVLDRIGMSLADVVPAPRTDDVLAVEPAMREFSDWVLPLPAPGDSDGWSRLVLPAQPSWCTELLAAELRAHRSMLEARDAWRSAAAFGADPTPAGAPSRAAQDRELWRARDRAIGLEAELAEARVAAAASAQQHEAATRDAWVAQERYRGELRVVAAELREMVAERDAMVASWQWRAGRVVVAPFQRVRRVLRTR